MWVCVCLCTHTSYSLSRALGDAQGASCTRRPALALCDVTGAPAVAGGSRSALSSDVASEAWMRLTCPGLCQIMVSSSKSLTCVHI